MAFFYILIQNKLRKGNYENKVRYFNVSVFIKSQCGGDTLYCFFTRRGKIKFT